MNCFHLLNFDKKIFYSKIKFVEDPPANVVNEKSDPRFVEHSC